GVRFRGDADLPGCPRAPPLLRPASRYDPYSGTGGSRHVQAVRDGRGVAIHPASDAPRLRAGGPENVAQAERRDAVVDADGRRFRIGGPAANGRRELPHQAAAGEPCPGPSEVRRPASVERKAAGARAESEYADA